MTVIAIAMVRDEEDIIGATVGNMVTQVDHVIVADNMSTDGTRQILERHLGDLSIVDDLDPAYLQSQKMTALAAMAREMGADWVVPFDADEWWTSADPYETISMTLAKVPDEFESCAATLFDHMATAKDPGGDPVHSMRWRRPTALAMPKIAVRASGGLIIDQGNHSATFYGKPKPAIGGLLTVHHFPYRSEGQFVRKIRNGAAAYAAGPDIRADFGLHWRQWGQILDRDGEQAVVEIFRKWYWREEPHVPIKVDGTWLEALVYDPVA